VQSAKEKGEEAKQTAQQTAEQAKQKVNEVCGAHFRVSEISQFQKAGTRANETKENMKKDL
jgi:hypothetical protein